MTSGMGTRDVRVRRVMEPRFVPILSASSLAVADTMNVSQTSPELSGMADVLGEPLAIDSRNVVRTVLR
jgi:hypothetical protein